MRVAGGAAAAVAVSRGTAFADELTNDQERSDASSTSGERVPGHRPHETLVVWKVPNDEPLLGITFDDGPDPQLTPKVLDALASGGVKATFFMIGERVTAHADIVRDVVAAGHDVGNHTWSHPDLGRAGQRETTRQLVDATKAIEDVTGAPVRYFRPPWGNLTGSAVRVAGELGQDIVLWTTSEEHLPRRYDAGDILLFHDGVVRGHTFLPRSTTSLRVSREQQVADVGSVIQRIRDAGLEPVPASTLLRR